MFIIQALSHPNLVADCRISIFLPVPFVYERSAIRHTICIRPLGRTNARRVKTIIGIGSAGDH